MHTQKQTASPQCTGWAVETRTINAEERAHMMGYPKNWTRGLNMCHQGRDEEYSRCHAVGNGFHLPSVKLLLVIIFGLMTPKAAMESEHVAQESRSSWSK